MAEMENVVVAEVMEIGETLLYSPELGTDLVTTLTGLQMNNLSH